MLERFKEHLQTFRLQLSNQPILLAVSGGIDSVCMTHLFYQAGIPFAMAHCNFGLRGSESDGDQNLVENLAKQYNCPLHVKAFETKKHSRELGISIQMAARELRYNWFEELADTNGYPYIAIAHNLNDSTETMLLNLIRGTGIKGLCGIRPQHGRIIRPLWFAHRNEIEAYISEQKLRYREDSSNAETKYYRNLIRKEIIPRLEGINPSLHHTFQHEARLFSATHALYEKELKRIREYICRKTETGIVIPISRLIEEQVQAPVLYEILEPYGFSYSDAEDILQGIHTQAGKQFLSESFQMVKDRDQFVLEPRTETNPHASYSIDQNTCELRKPIHLQMEYISRNESFTIPRSNTQVALDYNTLQFPLQLRHWHYSDAFHPLGMKGTKKLSDFFSDRKLNLFEKERIWLLTSNNTIVWVVGYQIDDRFKISPQTKKIALFTLKQ